MKLRVKGLRGTHTYGHTPTHSYTDICWTFVQMKIEGLDLQTQYFEQMAIVHKLVLIL